MEEVIPRVCRENMPFYKTVKRKYDEKKQMYTHMLTPTAKNRLKETAAEYKVSPSEVMETLIRSAEYQTIVSRDLLPANSAE